MSRLALWSRVLAPVLLLGTQGATLSAMQAPNDSVSRPADLPLHEVPARPGGHWMAVLITGDGGWVEADQELAHALADRGVAVVALDARAYLRAKKRSPRVAAADAERIIRYYEDHWKRDQIALVGYSRGADMMPFIANRLNEDLKDQIGLLALLGLSQRASFEFHWTDLFRDTRRTTDLPVVPELERLRGKRILCVYGTDDRNSVCRKMEQNLVMPVERSGAHRIQVDDASDLARTIVNALLPQ